MRNRSSAAVLVILVFFASAYTQRTVEDVLVSVPDINGMATDLVKPSFPETAVAVGADGSGVSLKVVVDEAGSVLSAQCSLNCHPMLKDAAELAARTSKFKPLIRAGRAVRYEGILLYTFVVDEVNWFRFGTSIESTRQFDNLSLGPVAQILSEKYSGEKAKLLSLDVDGVDFDTRQRLINETVTSIRGKIAGKDLWRFELAMALRRVTFWTMAAERTDRAALQRSIDELAAFANSAPEGISPAFITELNTLAKYRVSKEISEGDLRQAISEMSRNIPRYLR